MSRPPRPNALNMPGFFHACWLRLTGRDPADYATPFPRVGFIKRFLIRLSGVEPELFENYDVGLHARGEYANMGGSVLIPAAFAFVCATLTLKAVLGESENPGPAASWQVLGEHTLVCVLCGIGWALMIMRMDISIMSTMHKWVPDLLDGSHNSSGRGPRIIWRTFSYLFHHLSEIWVPVLRLTAAGVLGVVMSHCLVLLAFHVEIDNHIDQDRQAQIETINKVGDEALKEMTNKIAALRLQEYEETRVKVGGENPAASAVLPPSAARDASDDNLLKGDPQGRELLRRQTDNEAKLTLNRSRISELPDLIKAKEDEADMERTAGNKSVGRGAGEGDRFKQRKKEEQELRTEYTKRLSDQPVLEAEAKSLVTLINTRLADIITTLNTDEKNAREQQRLKQEASDDRLKDVIEAAQRKNISIIEANIADAEKRRQQYEATVRDEVARIDKLRKTKSYGILERSIHLHQMIFPKKAVPVGQSSSNAAGTTPAAPAVATGTASVVPAVPVAGGTTAAPTTATGTAPADPTPATGTAPVVTVVPLAGGTTAVATTATGTAPAVSAVPDAGSPPGTPAVAAGTAPAAPIVPVAGSTPGAPAIPATGTPPQEQGPASASDSLKNFIAGKNEADATDRGEMLWLIWAFTLAAFLVLDITPVLLKLLRRVSTVDILLQRLNEEALRRPLDEFRAPSKLYDPEEDVWNQPTTRRPPPPEDVSDEDDAW